VRVFSQAESRLGRLTVRRRRLTARGVPPVGTVPQVFAWCDVDGAVEPTTGARFFLELPSLTADTCPIVIDAFAPAFPDSLISLLLGHSGAHTAQRLQGPGNRRHVWRPPSGPELTPIERLWRGLQDNLAGLHFPTLEAQRLYVGDLRQASAASALPALTGYSSWVEATNALAS
jgi:hypothetical protein